METTVMVGEKPKVASRIAQALGDYSIEKNRGVKNYIIETDDREIIIAPAVGHIFNLKQSSEGWNYPIFDVEWAPIFETEDEANYVKKYYNNLKDQIKKADTYINACDFDIEGSTIGGNIIRLMANPENEKIQRMKFSTLTSSDLKQAFDNLEGYDQGMTQAGITRHKLDFFYGVNVSRALMQAVRENDRYKTLSTGRVQGPTLKLLADKEREIQEFEPDPYWEIYLNHKEFQAQWEDEEDRIWEEEKADQIFDEIKEEKQTEVTNIKINNYKHNPPIPFNLTGLQSEASSQLNISPKKTQSLAQELYENGLISYPRTESQKLPAKIGYEKLLKNLKNQDEYQEKAKKVLKKDEIYPRQGKKQDDAHPAIYPTGEPPSGLSKQQRQIYDLIVKRFFAVFGDAAKRRTLTFTLDVKGHQFKAKSKITVERNWFELYDPYVNVEEAELPEMEEGQTLQIEDFEQVEKETQPPRRYSESRIVNELEDRNLGTKCLTENQKVIIKKEEDTKKLAISELFSNHSNDGEQLQIEKISNELEVIGFAKNFKLSPFGGISRRKLKENEKVLEIQLSDGSTIRATSDHPILSHKEEDVQYVKARDLDKGNKVIRSHRASLEKGKEIGFSEFVKMLDENSSLYGDVNIKKFRNRKLLTQREMAKRLDTSRSTLSKVEDRKWGLLRYWQNAEFEKPEYISSENFDIKIENPFPIHLKPAFMRLVAMLKGDGSFDSSGKEIENKVDFRYHNTEKELINQFRRDVENIFGYLPEIRSQPSSKRSKTRYYVQLPAVIGRIVSIVTKNLSPDWIRKQENKDHYVGALLADEGHISPSEPKIFISNTDNEILRTCQETLSEKNIDSKINSSQKKLHIRGRRNLEKFLENIPLFSTRKHQALIDLLERHYRYGTGKGSLEKEKQVFKKLQVERVKPSQISEEIDMKKSKVKYYIDNLREKEYAEKIVEGKSERPRKEIFYKSTRNIADTFYTELGEKAIGEAHSLEIESVKEIEYDGYVYDILDTENQNFLLGNRVIVHNSTRAQTIDRLYDRNYIDNEPIEVTELGLAITETLEKHVPELLSEELTRKFEDKMEAIREGEESSEEVIEEARNELDETLQKFKKEEKQIGKELVETIDAERKRRRQLGPCDQCEDGTLRIVKTGNGRFVGCSNYPDCENTYPLPNDGKIESLREQCDTCNTPKIRVVREGRKPYTMCIDPDCPTKDDW